MLARISLLFLAPPATHVGEFLPFERGRSLSLFGEQLLLTLFCAGSARSGGAEGADVIEVNCAGGATGAATAVDMLAGYRFRLLRKVGRQNGAGMQKPPGGGPGRRWQKLADFQKRSLETPCR